MSIDDGTAAAYQAIAGDSLRLSLDRPLCLAVTGSPQLLVNPSLVFSISVGASTVATKRVVANLFYRNMLLRHQVFQGQTLETTTSVAALADASPKPGSPPRGKALLQMHTTADGQPLLDYQRCALIPCRHSEPPGHSSDVGQAEGSLDLERFGALVPDWDLTPLGDHDRWETAAERTDPLHDVVDNATALVRLTQNVAAVHRDATASQYGRRLVYGGHTIALAQASLSRVLGGLATVLGWQSCNHLAPVFEEDVLACTHTLIGESQTPTGTVRAIRVEVDAIRASDDGTNERITVLDWMPVVLTT